MRLAVLGFNYKTAPLNVREKLSLDREASAEFSKRLISQDVISEAMVISTCNRTEIYAAGACAEGIKETMIQMLAEVSSLDASSLKDSSYFYSQEECLSHLFRVASSLDSMVVGEAQVLGQLKEAYQTAVEYETVGAYLHKACHAAFRVAKRVRTETSLAELPVSIGSLATELAEKEASRLNGANVLVIGAGEISSLVATHLKERGVAHIWIANRSVASAEMLAKEVRGIVVPFDSWPVHLQTADIVVTSIGGGILIEKAHIEKASLSRQGRPLIMIDLAVPRNVAHDCEHSNVKLFNIDDLETLAEKNLEARRDAALAAEGVISIESKISFNEIQAMRIAPVMENLRKKCYFVIESETYRLFKENPGLTLDEQSAVKRCVETVVKKIIHEPIKLAKEEMVKSEGSEGRAEEFLNKLLTFNS